jgi:hypothetical protein
MAVFDVAFVCVGFEVGIFVWCVLAMYLRDECVGPCPCAYRHFRTCSIGRVGEVPVCDLIG